MGSDLRVGQRLCCRCRAVPERRAGRSLPAHTILKKLIEEFPTVPAYQIELGGAYCNYGETICNDGKPADSLERMDLAIRTLKPVHDQEPGDVKAMSILRNSHWARAEAYDRLQKPAETGDDWNRAIELTPPAEHSKLRIYRMTSRVGAGMVAEVAELTKDSNWDASLWYNFACVYAVASGKIPDKKQEYADRAMELLQQAVNAGWTNAAHMAKGTDVDSLRDRDDFRKLCDSLSEPEPKDP